METGRLRSSPWAGDSRSSAPARLWGSIWGGGVGVLGLGFVSKLEQFSKWLTLF